MPSTFALIGTNIAKSASPDVHRRWHATFDLEASYILLDIETWTPQTLTELWRTHHLRGANVTSPFKGRAASSVALVGDDAWTTDARLAESVNTIRWKDNRPEGCSTDGEGLCRALEAQGVSLRDIHLVVLGLGGAGRAIAAAATRRGVGRLSLVSRRRQAAADLAGRLALPDEHVHSFQPGGPVPNADVYIDTTGAAAGLEVSSGPASPSLWLDLRTHTTERALHTIAERFGCATNDGMGMLTHQAALSFQWWTGHLPEVQ